MNVQSLRRASSGIVGGDFSDPTNERLIYLSALGLAIIGLALLVGTILWWRRGRREHPALAPLEVMSGRAWAKAPEGDRRRRLDHVRLAGAGATENAVVRAAPVDLEALVRSVPQAFDDLREPSEPAHEVADPPVDEVAEAAGAAPPDSVEVAAEAEAEVEPDAEAETGVQPAPVATEVDATSVSTERPPEAVEVLASGPTDPSS